MMLTVACAVVVAVACFGLAELITWLDRDD